MYSLVNTIVNRSLIPLYCTYSALPEDGHGDDIWKVSILPGRAVSTDTDIDYIKPISPSNQLAWGGTNGGVVRPYWQTNNWVKVRQWVTTEILSDYRAPTLGYLKMWFAFPGVPARALDEARKYDGGRDEAARGSTKVQGDMNEWDEIIVNGKLSMMRVRKLEPSE